MERVEKGVGGRKGWWEDGRVWNGVVGEGG